MRTKSHFGSTEHVSHSSHSVKHESADTVREEPFPRHANLPDKGHTSWPGDVRGKQNWRVGELVIGLVFLRLPNCYTSTCRLTLIPKPQGISWQNKFVTSVHRIISKLRPNLHVARGGRTRRHLLIVTFNGLRRLRH